MWGCFFSEAKSGTQLSQHFSASLHVSILHHMIILHPPKMYDEINQDFLELMTGRTIKISHVSSITDVLCHPQLKKWSQAHSYIHPPFHTAQQQLTRVVSGFLLELKYLWKLETTSRKKERFLCHVHFEKE